MFGERAGSVRRQFAVQRLEKDTFIQMGNLLQERDNKVSRALVGSARLRTRPGEEAEQLQAPTGSSAGRNEGEAVQHAQSAAGCSC